MDTTSIGTAVDAGLVKMGSFMGKVYGIMSLGLLLSAVIAFAMYNSPNLFDAIIRADLILPIFLLELVLVIALQSTFNKLPFLASLAMFAVYSILNGVVFGVILYGYTATSIATTFGATAVTFAIMSVYGLTAKQDLTKFGQLAIMGVIGLLVGSVINIFVASDAFSWVLTYFGIAVFVVLVAYKSQQIKSFYQMGEQTGNSSKYALFAAFSLYLSFINIFILLLRIFGKRR